MSGIELGEPHWHVHRAATLLDVGAFDRVLGSVHAMRASDTRFLEIAHAYREYPAAHVVHHYLREATLMVGTSESFAVLAHVDYAARSWPAVAGPYDPAVFEEDYRDLLSALAGTGRALEINTMGPLHPKVVRWWHEAGGDAVAFGSDAHEPAAVAHDFHAAAALAEAHGFRHPSSDHRHESFPRNLDRHQAG